MKYDEKYGDSETGGIYEEKYGDFGTGDIVRVHEPDNLDFTPHIHELILNKAKRKCVECGSLTSWTDNSVYICSEECTTKHCGHPY